MKLIYLFYQQYLLNLKNFLLKDCMIDLSLTKKIGEKIDGGYSSFAKYYQNEWILSNLNSEFNVISSNLESATRKDNPLL